ncbi:MAG: DUF4837 family protein [Gemmatimonadetes bacterium]|nr:DUF4837 family protein [Gemmatimonadota bacterium]MXX71141.1 DUF4837 family protein [Gemmatimonadota bacterium]MYC92704.1 DUF4837 family protein [Gemmatimonadota bacterium]MYG34882.1 DUF4837 family protein [Gemmatimonadota bacterium]
MRGTSMKGTRATAAVAVGAALTGVAACDTLPLAMGDVHAIVVSASPELWAEVGETAFTALEGSVFTVRDEHAFRVMYAEPTDSAWAGLRRLRQLLLIGKASDPWMAAPLAGLEEPVTPPQVVQVDEVWARQQLVTLLVLEEGTGSGEDAAAVREQLPDLFAIYDGQYRQWVVNRMFSTAPDTALARTLRDDHGFQLIVPEVYDYQLQDSVHIFRNDNPDPSELIRQFAITWQSPVPEGVGEDEIVEWRTRIADQYYDYPQFVNRDVIFAGPGDFGGKEAYSVQGVWQNPPGAYPAAGPFIARTITCAGQQRLYLVDAWLYAPSRDKYEYMIQLDEILNSFRCME